MNTAITKAYQLGHLPIRVYIRKEVISIDFTTFKDRQDLALLYHYREKLIALVKCDYEQLYGKQLEISNASLVAEIWGHLLAYKVALWFQQHINIALVQKFAKFVAFRSGLVDCGSRKIDTNRWFWDILAAVFFRKYNLL